MSDELIELKEANKTLTRIALLLSNLAIKEARVVENTDNIAYNLREAIKQRGPRMTPDQDKSITLDVSGLAQRLHEYTGFSKTELLNEIHAYWGIRTREDDY